MTPLSPPTVAVRGEAELEVDPELAHLLVTVSSRDRDRSRALARLTERLDSVDGILVVDSPPGGPTTVTAELPWRG